MGYYMTYQFWFLSFSGQLSSGCTVNMLIKDGLIMKSRMQSALQYLNMLLLWSRIGTPDARSLAHRRQSREHFLISGLVGQDNFPEELYVSRRPDIVGRSCAIPRVD